MPKGKSAAHSRSKRTRRRRRKSARTCRMLPYLVAGAQIASSIASVIEAIRH
jgi:hypothetical protein